MRSVGTGLGVLLPKKKLEEMGLREGDTIVITRIERPAKEIRGMLKGSGFRFNSKDGGETGNQMSSEVRPTYITYVALGLELICPSRSVFT